MFRHTLTALVVVWTTLASNLLAQDIGFIERFALADDRASALDLEAPAPAPPQMRRARAGPRTASPGPHAARGTRCSRPKTRPGWHVQPGDCEE